MPSYAQNHQLLRLNTPLGPDVLLLVGLDGHEGISELFHFDVEAWAVRPRQIEFERLLGQPVLIEHVADGTPVRWFHGIVSRIGELGQDDTFTRYRLEVVPALWLLSLNVQCRIYQHQSVPDILGQVLHGLDLAFRLQGNYLPHNYCVQYCESDFQFASRLMEEEGISYFFEHSHDGHRLVLVDRSADNPELPGMARVRFDPQADARRRGACVDRWQKFQELRPGRYTLFDHSFELPSYRLDASAEASAAPMQAGGVSHDLGLLRQRLQVYEYPGEYAHRFDSIGPNGEKRDRPLEELFNQNQQLAQLRLQEQQAQSLRIEGAGNCGQFTPGYRFTLGGHPNADGQYLLTRVEHAARLSDPRGQGDDAKPYENHFACLPRDLPFRPPRRTRRARVPGSQTATVVGPKDQEVWTDKYGRIKVHFHWDRDGQSDGLDSCWVRVASNWAGKGFGLLSMPRVGQEVVVDFLEGDPDQPLVTGSVYNAEQLTPFHLPGNRSVTTLKTQTMQGDSSAFHGLAFDDQKDQELLYLRSQKDLMFSAVRNQVTFVPSNQYVQVGGGQLFVVGGLPLPFTAGNRNSDAAENGEEESGEPEESREEGHEEEGHGEEAEADWLEWMGVEMEPIPLAVKIDGTYGVELNFVAGIKSYFDFPASVECVVDPLGVVGALATSIVPAAGRFGAGAAGLTGETTIVYGNKADLHYGPLVEVHRGPVLKAQEKMELPTMILSVLHAGSVLATMALPAVLAQFKTGPWLKNSTLIAYGIATGLQWLTTQLEIRWTKAVAALDTAEEALEKAEQALAQLNSKTLPSFTEQLTQLAGSFTLMAEKVEKQSHTNLINGPFAVTAGDLRLSARTTRNGTGRIDIDADADINLNPTGKVTAHAGGNMALRGANLAMNCSGTGNVTIGSNDLAPITFIQLKIAEILLQSSPLTKIKLDALGITLTCGNSSLAITPTGIKLNGLSIDIQSLLSKQTAFLQEIK